MAGTFPPLYQREESLLIRESCTLHRTLPARALWGTGNRSVARSTKSFLRWTRAIWTCRGSLSGVCRRETAFRSACGYPPLGKREVDGKMDRDISASTCQLVIDWLFKFSTHVWYLIYRLPYFYYVHVLYLVPDLDCNAQWKRIITSTIRCYEI